MGKDDANKIGIIVVSCVLLAAMVVVIVEVTQESKDEKAVKASATQKAVTAICETTDYKKTCIKSLDGQDTTDPKELIQAAMQATIDYIKGAIHNSTALKNAQSDPRARAALDTCAELGNRAVDDLHRSYNKFSYFDITNVDHALLELKTWISGAMTHQETCLDAFEKVPGDAGGKMKDLLTTSMHMTSNALAMVAEISIFLESMGIQGYQKSSMRRRLRRSLLSQEDVGGWVDAEKRRLLAMEAVKIRPNIIVAKDGSGNFATINEALQHIPKKNNKTFVIYVKQGIYQEQVFINNTFTNLMIIGDGPTKTRITGNLNFVDGVGTYQTATVAVQGDDFIARDIGFENSAGAIKLQAVALRASSDKSIYYNCHIEAYQDTLYTHAYRQFYKDCLISGTIDFLFGDSAAIFQDCTLLFRKPLEKQQNIVTAQGRVDLRQPTGLVIQNCSFKADAELEPFKYKFKSYLGRPWKEFSRTIIMESFIDDFIDPEGWMPWEGNFAFETLFYAEFNNRGPGAAKAKRVKWGGVKELPPNRIKRFTAAEFLDGNRWIPPQRVPYAAGFMFPVPNEDPNIHYSPVTTDETKDLGSTAERKKKTGNSNSTATASTPQPSVAAPAPAMPPSSGAVVLDLAPSPALPPNSASSQPPPRQAASPSGGGGPTPSTRAASPAISPKAATSAPLVSPKGSPKAAAPLLSPKGNPIAAPSPKAAAPLLSPKGNPIAAPSPKAAAARLSSKGSPRAAPSPKAAAPLLSPKGSPRAAPSPKAPASSSSPTAQPAKTASPTASPKLSPQKSQAPTLAAAAV